MALRLEHDSQQLNACKRLPNVVATVMPVIGGLAPRFSLLFFA